MVTKVMELTELNNIVKDSSFERIIIIKKEYFEELINKNTVRLIVDYHDKCVVHDFEEYIEEEKFQNLVLKPIYDIQGLNHVKKIKYSLYNYAQYETEDGTHEIANDVIGYMYTWEFYK